SLGQFTLNVTPAVSCSAPVVENIFPAGGQSIYEYQNADERNGYSFNRPEIEFKIYAESGIHEVLLVNPPPGTGQSGPALNTNNGVYYTIKGEYLDEFINISNGQSFDIQIAVTSNCGSVTNHVLPISFAPNPAPSISLNSEALPQLISGGYGTFDIRIEDAARDVISIQAYLVSDGSYTDISYLDFEVGEYSDGFNQHVTADITDYKLGYGPVGVVAGNHDLIFEITDSADNTSSLTIPVTVQEPLTPPVVTISSSSVLDGRSTSPYIRIVHLSFLESITVEISGNVENEVTAVYDATTLQGLRHFRPDVSYTPSLISNEGQLSEEDILLTTGIVDISVTAIGTNGLTTVKTVSVEVRPDNSD
ncbi:MAG: hypothetical protein GY935_03430, partial [Gammaproteobacteria bacterium]|nr:hypothetical protein [Gammaproteobacteria bacterium]